MSHTISCMPLLPTPHSLPIVAAYPALAACYKNSIGSLMMVLFDVSYKDVKNCFLES